MLDNTPHQLSKFRTKNWVEMHDDDAPGTYSTNSQIKFQAMMLKSSLSDYSNALILVTGIIAVANLGIAAAPNRGKKVFLLCVIDIFSKYAWFIPLKDRKGITITNSFPKILDESNRKPNKI